MQIIKSYFHVGL